MDVVIFGPPGSGKGTQGKLLAEQLGVPHMSTGAIMRAEMDDSSLIGSRCAEYVLSGMLVPDPIVIEMVAARLHFSAARGAVFDGFPRSEMQAIALNAMLWALGRQVDHIISLHVPAEECVRRMLGRGRLDDDEFTARKRLNDHVAVSSRVLNRLDARRFSKIAAMPPVDQVAQTIRKALGVES